MISNTSEEEIVAEMRENFGDVPPEERVSVCDPCYQKMLAAYPIEIFRIEEAGRKHV